MLTARIKEPCWVYIRVVGENMATAEMRRERDELAHTWLRGSINSPTAFRPQREVRRRFCLRRLHENSDPGSHPPAAGSHPRSEEMDPGKPCGTVHGRWGGGRPSPPASPEASAPHWLRPSGGGPPRSWDLAAVARRAPVPCRPRWRTPPSHGGDQPALRLYPPVYGRAVHLYQICFNLMENAIKYNLPGGKVFVSVCRDGDQVLLEVADTGIGIPGGGVTQGV